MSLHKSIMDIGKGKDSERKKLRNELKTDVSKVEQKYAPGTIFPEVPVTDLTKADTYNADDLAKGLGQGGATKTLPAMKYSPEIERLQKNALRLQIQNTYPGRAISDAEVETAWELRKEIMIRDFDQWVMTAFDLKQPGVAKMLEEYYPEILERITNMIDQDLEIIKHDKYHKVFFPGNYEDLVMRWSRERGWIKTMDEIERENVAKLRYGGDDGKAFRAGYTPDLAPMFNGPEALLSNDLNRPFGRNDVDFGRGNPFGAMFHDTHGTRGPALPTSVGYSDANLLPRVVNPAAIQQQGGAGMFTGLAEDRQAIADARGVGSSRFASITDLKASIKKLVTGDDGGLKRTKEFMQGQATALSEGYTKAAEVYRGRGR